MKLVSFCFHGPFFFKTECQQLNQLPAQLTILHYLAKSESLKHTHTPLRLLISCSCTLYINVFGVSAEHCELVWPSGKVLGWYCGKQRDLGSNPHRLSFFFKSSGLWTLSSDFVPHN